LENLINEAAILAGRGNRKVIGMEELKQQIAGILGGRASEDPSSARSPAAPRRHTACHPDGAAHGHPGGRSEKLGMVTLGKRRAIPRSLLTKSQRPSPMTQEQTQVLEIASAEGMGD